ncbi:MAG: uracil phosphoribosyltransferase [Planctomycetes bacterium]|nr:uracil phosphoribosyltransferase [Planctomycetota bacterium]
MDRTYRTLRYRLSEAQHRYGEGFHLLAEPYSLSLLARLCSPDTRQPEVNTLITLLYQHLVGVVASQELPRARVRIDSRMKAQHPEGTYVGEAIDPETPAITASIARAGMLPSQVCFDTLNHLLSPARVRQDHIFMNRKLDRRGRVIGVDLVGSKIGGPVDDAIVLIPDPMGATASSMSATVELYRNRCEGTPRKLVALHCIVTPEYLRRMRSDHPELVVYAIRLDRGLSPPDVLATVPGTAWDRERGLNDHQYIVPGGGGFGELLNNALR